MSKKRRKYIPLHERGAYINETGGGGKGRGESQKGNKENMWIHERKTKITPKKNGGVY